MLLVALFLHICIKVENICIKFKDICIKIKHESWEFSWNRLEISIHIPISLPCLSWILNALIKVKYLRIIQNNLNSNAKIRSSRIFLKSDITRDWLFELKLFLMFTSFELFFWFDKILLSLRIFFSSLLSEKKKPI